MRPLLSSREQTQHAAQALLNDTTEWVLVTSAPGVAQHEDEVGLMLVTRQEAQCFTHPKVKSAVKGTGDLFTALLVSHLLHGAALDAAVAPPAAKCATCWPKRRISVGKRSAACGRLTPKAAGESEGQRTAPDNYQRFSFVEIQLEGEHGALNFALHRQPQLEEAA